MALPAGFSDEDFSDEDGLYIEGVNTSRKKFIYRKPSISYSETKEEKLLYAVTNQQFDEVKNLIDDKVDINHKSSKYGNWTPLMHACHLGNVQITKYLLEKGANIQEHHELMTPILCLCDSKNRNEDELIECLDVLVEFEANINDKDWFKANTLVYAVKRGHQKLLIKLLNLGCNIENTDSDGWTPIFYAVDGGMLHIVQLLKDAGAKINKIDNRGRSLHDIAITKHYKDIAEIVSTSENHVDIDMVIDQSRGYKRMSNYEYVLSELPSRTEGRFYGFHRDAVRWVNGIGLESLVNLFIEKNVQLNEILTMENEDLKKLGVTLSYDRKKLKYCVQKFHEHSWGKNSLITPPKDEDIGLSEAAQYLCNLIQQLHICSASTYFWKMQGGYQSSKNSKDYAERALYFINCLQKEKNNILKFVQKIEEEEKLVPADIVLPETTKGYCKLKIIISVALGFCLITTLKPRVSSWLADKLEHLGKK